MVKKITIKNKVGIFLIIFSISNSKKIRKHKAGNDHLHLISPCLSTVNIKEAGKDNLLADGEGLFWVHL